MAESRFVYICEPLDIGIFFLRQCSSELLGGNFEKADSHFRIAKRFIDQRHIDNYIVNLIQVGMKSHDEENYIEAENILTGAVNYSNSDSEDKNLLIKSYLERGLVRFHTDNNEKGILDLESILENTGEGPLENYLFEARVSAYGLLGNYLAINIEDYERSLDSFNKSYELIRGKEDIGLIERLSLYHSNLVVIRNVLNHLDENNFFDIIEDYVECYRITGAQVFKKMDENAHLKTEEFKSMMEILGKETFFGGIKCARILFRKSMDERFEINERNNLETTANRIVLDYERMEGNFYIWLSICNELSGVNDHQAKRFLLKAKKELENSPDEEFDNEYLDIYDVLKLKHGLDTSLNPFLFSAIES